MAELPSIAEVKRKAHDLKKQGRMTHGQCLERVARDLGFASYSALTARYRDEGLIQPGRIPNRAGGGNE